MHKNDHAGLLRCRAHLEIGTEAHHEQALQPARSEDARLTVWEATQHLIKRLEEQGEQAAAQLLKQLGPHADSARDLAYRLYNTCERRGWAEEARAYNGLVIAWPELEKLVAAMPAGQTIAQFGLGIDTGPEKPTKPATKSSRSI